MVVIRVLLQVKPNEEQAFQRALASDAESTRTLPGCHRFELYADVRTEHGYLLYEEWDSMSSFDAYRTSQQFQDSGRVLFPMMAGKPDSAYFDAQQFGPG